jgi:hypothetical protein
MMDIHFPCIEAGRVRSACGVVHAHVAWTTSPDKVTCPRCRTLLHDSDDEEPRGPLSRASAEPGYTDKTR